jgi:Tol biopolymer transport system component
VSDRDITEAVYLANEDGSAITRLIEGRAPAWSKDGRRIAFERASNIYVINVDGSGLQQVTQGTHPSFSPDGSRLAFGDWGLYVVDANGSNRRKLFEDGGHGAFTPVWSPDGQRIAFRAGTSADVVDFHGLWTVSPDGSGAQRLLGDGWVPAWSPDSSRIAYVTSSGIGVASADGSGQRQQVAGAIFDVDWTPDGRLIITKYGSPNPGALSRIFISDGLERQLIPEATAPARRDYLDSQAAWRR